MRFGVVGALIEGAVHGMFVAAFLEERGTLDCARVKHEYIGGRMKKARPWLQGIFETKTEKTPHHVSGAPPYVLTLCLGV